jgi:multidrug efflux pump subunit AcrA (membrane-fusion protein)
MEIRKIIISLLALAILGGGYLIKNKLASTERPQRPKKEKAIPTVFTQEIKNTTIPMQITASGNLEARDRIEIFSEVQGVFEYSSRSFKPGVYYKAGETLLRINSDESRASLRSQKSAFYNQVVAILPDLKFDYPEVYEKWKNYANAFDIEKSLPALPEITEEKEKLFIASRNINSSWYNVKNIEERLSKFAIYAPFNGTLTEATVDKGALIRAGQKLGEFISPNVLELEVAVNSSYADLLKIGNSVKLSTVDRAKSYTGKISRINSLIDPTTQTIQAYIRVNGKGLREGMYLEADLEAEKIENAFEISRKLLVGNDKVYKVDGDSLLLTKITPVHFTENTVIIKGMENGDLMLSKPIPGAFNGMQVKIYEN